MLDRRIPSNWATKCDNNNLSIAITPTKKVEAKNLKAYLYRELANSMIYIAKNSPVDGLERVLIVSIEMHSKELQINAITEGKDIVKFSTIRDRNLVLDHMRSTVNVKEIAK